MNKKECTKCGKIKNINEFNKTSNGNPKGKCKECVREYNNEYRINNMKKDSKIINWERDTKEHKEHCRELYGDRFYLNPLREHYAFKKEGKKVYFI